MKEFIPSIHALLQADKRLFYNHKGLPQAYKLGVRHLSAALHDGTAVLVNGKLFFLKESYLVDFENQTINLYKCNSWVKLSSL